MGNPLPDISSDTFDRSNAYPYHRVTLLQGAVLEDSAFNESQDIARWRDWLTVATTAALDTRVGDGFYVSESAVPINNVAIGGGRAICFGSIVMTLGETVLTSGSRVFYYEPTNPSYFNRICEGTITSVEAAAHKVRDENKYWLPDHMLSGCRLVMTSGAEIGNVFLIKNDYLSGWDQNTLVLDVSSTFRVRPGDTYVVVPPKLTTPALGSSTLVRTDLVYLQTWYEHINEIEDSSLYSKQFYPAVFTNKVQLRWCVRVAEGYYDPTTAQMVAGVLPTPLDSEDPFGVHYLPLATLTRPSGEPRIVTSQISNYRGVEVPLPALSQEMTDARLSDRLGGSTSLAGRLTALENTVTDSKVFNGSFELGSTTGAAIPGWIPSSTCWSIATAGARHQSRCAMLDHTSRGTTQNESLTSWPFYVRPGQTLAFRASARVTAATNATASATLELFDATAAWSGTPILSTVLNFDLTKTEWSTPSGGIVAPAAAQWGRVVIHADQQSGVLYVDDIRVEFLEEAMNNTRGDGFPAVEIFSGRFQEGLRGWNVNQRYAADANVVAHPGSPTEWPYLTLAPAGSMSSVEISSWPVNLGSIGVMDDVVMLTVEGRYSGISAAGVTSTGSYVKICFYDDTFTEVTTSNEKFFLNANDWGTSAPGAANPAGSEFNAYTALFNVPRNAAMFTISLGVASTSGTADFRNVQVTRFGSSVAVGLNRTYHDLAVNGEFGRGILDETLTTDADKRNPPQNKFEIMNWVSTESSTSGGQLVFWPRNDTTLNAPSGDRVLHLQATGGVTPTGAQATVFQTAARTLTTQDFLHGFVLDFLYNYTSPVVPTDRAFNLVVDFLDSLGAPVCDPTVIPLLDGVVATPQWSRKVVGIAPPTRTTASFGGTDVYKTAVFLRYGFQFNSGTMDATTFSANVASVHLWSRTIPTSGNTVTDDQYRALKGYYTFDTAGYTKDSSYYESGFLTPGSNNPYLLAKDSDLMRYTRPHALRHYPAATTATTIPAGQNADPIPAAAATQTGLLSASDWVQFTDALQKEDLAGLFHTGVHEGLYVDEYGNVSAGYAIDLDNRRLEVPATSVTIPPLDSGKLASYIRYDVVYLYYDEVTAAPKVAILVGSNSDDFSDDASSVEHVFADVDTNSINDILGAYKPGIRSLPRNAIILAIGIYWEAQCLGEINNGFSSSSELLVQYKRHWMGTGAHTEAQAPEMPVYDDYNIFNAPIEYLFNATRAAYLEGDAPENDAVSSALRALPVVDNVGTGTVIPTCEIPRYQLIDCRCSAYRILQFRDSNLIMYYTIAPYNGKSGAQQVGYGPADMATTGYRSVTFDEFGTENGGVNNAYDVGWGQGQPLSGAFETWSDFLSAFGNTFDVEHRKEGSGIVGFHRRVTIPYDGVDQWTAVVDKRYDSTTPSVKLLTSCVDESGNFPVRKRPRLLLAVNAAINSSGHLTVEKYDEAVNLTSAYGILMDRPEAASTTYTVKLVTIANNPTGTTDLISDGAIGDLCVGVDQASFVVGGDEQVPNESTSAVWSEPLYGTANNNTVHAASVLAAAGTGDDAKFPVKRLAGLGSGQGAVNLCLRYPLMLPAGSAITKILFKHSNMLVGTGGTGQDNVYCGIYEVPMWDYTGGAGGRLAEGQTSSITGASTFGTALHEHTCMHNAVATPLAVAGNCCYYFSVMGVFPAASLGLLLAGPIRVFYTKSDLLA